MFLANRGQPNQIKILDQMTYNSCALVTVAGAGIAGSGPKFLRVRRLFSVDMKDGQSEAPRFAQENGNCPQLLPGGPHLLHEL